MSSLFRWRSIRIVVDTILLIGFLAEFATREGPDYALHSWIGVALVPIVGIHLSSNWRWVRSTFDRRRNHPEWSLALFNAAFAVVTFVCIVSGFPLWLDWSQASALVTAHTLTGLVSIVLAVAHLWRNRERIRRLIRPSRSATATAGYG